MPKKRHLYSAIFDGKYPFAPLYDDVTTVTSPDELHEEHSTLIIWGGGDISPSLYNHRVASRCHASERPGQRDLIEWHLAESAVAKGIPVIGICRGAQLMCAMSGGSLIQDVTGHTRDHAMRVNATGATIHTSSLHHQMMFPWGIEHEMIATAYPVLSNQYSTRPKDAENDVDLEDVPCEPEIIWFPTTKSLCIQGHPEFLGVAHPFVQFCFDLVRKYGI